MKNNAFCRIAPFALYMSFIAVEGGLRFLAEKGVVAISAKTILGLYPIKALSVAILLLLYWKSYTEVSFRDIIRPLHTLVSVIAGIGVFILWVNMDFSFATAGKPPGFDPGIFQDQTSRLVMVAARLFGAVMVVPAMEELFWRSFLIRYIIDQDFAKVRLGLFTWPSFLITVVLFGLEHHLFLAGMMAGVAYNLLLYYTRSLSLCIIAHSVTNLALGIFVLETGRWYFW